VIWVGKRRIWAGLALFGLLLSGCSVVRAVNPFDEARVVPGCPPIGLLKDADQMTIFRDGPGRDISDVVLETEITGFKGECEYIGDPGSYTEVILNLRVSFDMILGPAGRRRDHKLEYFIAVPDFFPRQDGRSEFSAEVKFPPRRNRVTFTDDPLEITIPLDENRQGPETKVVISLALTRDQLQFNRSNSKTRLRE
jgi:hypothetical protein